MKNLTELFGPPIYGYTRKQALENGEQVDVSTTAREAGIRFPMFITRRVFESCVAVPPGVSCQDEAGRLWDVVWMSRVAIVSNRDSGDLVEVKLHVRNSNRRGIPPLVTLWAKAGPMDIDDPRPAITIMFPDED